MPIKPSLAAVLLLALHATAQAPSPTDLAGKAHELARQLGELLEAEQPDDEQKAQLEAKKKELAEFVALCARAEDWTEDHYVQAGSPLLQQCPAEAIAISEAGLKRFPTARFLFDHVGMGHLHIAVEERPCAARMQSLQAAAKAFREALKHQPDTVHAHVGLWQALDLLGEYEESFLQLQAVLRDEEGKQALGRDTPKLAGFLLRAGKLEQAKKALTTGDADDPLTTPILKLRGAALSKDVAATEAAAAALRKVEDSPRTLVESADALAFVGKKDAALQLLGKRPPPAKKWESEEERVAQLWLQSAAALEAVLKASDVTPKGPLRAALTKTLEHTFTVMDAGSKPPKNTDLSSSPLAMASLLANAPASGEKDWGNRILMVLCLRALPDHEPGKLESAVIGMQKEKASADDIPALLAAARYAVGDPEQSGVLTGLRVLEQIEPAAKPKK